MLVMEHPEVFMICLHLCAAKREFSNHVMLVAEPLNVFFLSPEELYISPLGEVVSLVPVE